MKSILLLLFLFSAIIFLSCNKKSHPAKADTAVVKKVPKVKTPVPQVIVVNDQIAKKTFDGRLYYDLEGKRYWRSNKDGKYYLYNKAMYSDPNFKAPKKSKK